MTISHDKISNDKNDKNVIAGKPTTAEGGENNLHTADIAKTREPDSEVLSKVQHDDGNGNGKLNPLFADDVDRDFRNRWRDIQGGFVDEPRSAVERADKLVAQLMQRLAQSFSEQRSSLEKQWEASEKVSTEDLRVALTRYRSFFERLLSI